MKDLLKNSAHNALLETIMSFNSAALFNKSDYEIILEGLKIYLHIIGCTSATLFSIDPDTYEFYYRTSTALNLECGLKKIFEQLVEAGAVAEALKDSDIVEHELIEEEGQKNYCVLIPLIVPSGIIGITLITLTRSLKEKEILIDLCRLHSNNFALTTQNCVLSHELNQLKENTEQKIALRTNDIAKSTRELKKILDSIHTGIILVNKSTGYITEANIMALNIIETKKENLLTKKRDEYFFFHGNKKSDEGLKTSQEGLLKRNNGTLVPIIRTEAEVSLGGNDFIIESFIDITERKKIEDSLQKAHFELEQRVEERTLELRSAYHELEDEIRIRERAEANVIKLSRAVEQSPAAILITGLDGKIQYTNPSFTRMTGYTSDEIVSLNPRFLKNSRMRPEIYNSIWNSITTGSEWMGEFENSRKNGASYWTSATFSPIKDANGDVTHYLSIQEDITDKKRMLEELVVAKNRAEESDKMKSTLLANMSHEFRTPLIGILGFSQFLSSELEEPGQKEMLTSIYSSGKRLLNTLDGVLKLSELESMESIISFTKLNIAEILPDIIQPMMKLIDGKNLEFKLNLENDSLIVSSNSNLLKSCIINIIDNAVKYTNTGSIIISATKEKDETNDWVAIKIKDTGIGIKENDCSVIFEAFRQASEGYTRDYEGCGLGLTISEKLAKLLKGKITVVSEFSKGSEFTIWLPELLMI